MSEQNSSAKRRELIRLLRYDFFRFFSAITFKVCFVVGVVFVLLGSVVSFLAYTFSDDLMPLLSMIYSPSMIQEMGFAKPTTQDLFTNLSAHGLPVLLATITVTNFITSEFSASTIRTLVAKGFGKIRIYLSKLMVSLIGTLLIVLVLGAIAIGLDLAFYGVDGSEIEPLRVLRFLVMNFVSFTAYCSIFTALAMIIRSGAAVMTINILLITLSSMLVAILDIPFSSLGISLFDYWIVTFTGNMLEYSFNDGYYLTCLVGAACYAVVFTAAGALIFKKTDIK